MIHQASVADISGFRIGKQHGHIVVVTRYYPRFLKRKQIHEYVSDLAPSKELLKEFKAAEDLHADHDQGFEAVDYENKFELSAAGYDHLKRLAEMSRERPVYLVCHCRRDQYCHRELLMILANHLYGTSIGRLSHPYTDFHKRLK